MILESLNLSKQYASISQSSLKAFTVFFLLIFLALPRPSFCADMEQEILKLAEKEHKAGQYKSAYSKLEKLLEKFPKSKSRDKILVWQAECCLRCGDLERASEKLTAYFENYADSKYSARANYYQGILEIKSGNALNGVRTLCRLLDENEENAIDSLAREGIRLFINTVALENEVSALESEFSSKSALKSDLLYFSAVRYMREAKYQSAVEKIKEFLREFPKDERSPELKDILKAAEKQVRAAFHVSVLLPISGEYKSAGLSVLRSVELAFEQYNQESKNPVVWNIVNTRGKPLNSVLSVQKIIRESSAQTIIGPLLSDEMIASGAALGESGIPLLSPTATGENITAVNPSLYQIAVTPQTLSMKLGQYAINVLKIRDFIVIAPLTEYGNIMTESFKDALSKLGGKCTMVEFYEEGETNFREIYKRIRKKQYRLDCAQKLKGRGYLPANDSVCYHPVKRDSIRIRDTLRDSIDISVGGIFLPCNEDEIIALASQADHYLIKGQLLGTTAWYSQTIMEKKQGRKAVEGAILCVDFVPEANPAQWNNFQAMYMKKYGLEPDRIAGQGYDTARLLCNILGQTGEWPVRGRTIHEQLQRVSGFQGVSGKITINPETRSNSEGVIIRIRDGSFVRVF